MQTTGQTATGGSPFRPNLAATEDGHIHTEQEADRRRVETVVETLAALRSPGETLSEVAHDARNMVTALGLYCDLLEEPGVLAIPYLHYAHELRLVAAASRSLVEKIAALDRQSTAGSSGSCASVRSRSARSAPTSPAPALLRGTGQAVPEDGGSNRRWDLVPAVPIANLATELMANRNLLSALAGPSIALTIDAAAGAGAVRLTGEDLTRILVNLVKNATEAMPAGGRIHLCLSEMPAALGVTDFVVLTIEDNGPGIAEDALQTIFTSGYTTRARAWDPDDGWRLPHRGLGLAITRSIIEGAGGRITASNRETGGARFVIELPAQPALQNRRDSGL